MVNVSLIEAILREQDNPGCSTTRQIRDIYNIRSGEDPVIQYSNEDKEFQSILLKALEAYPVVDDDEDEPISYTVKLKDSDEEKPSTASSITITKPFSPLFLNNMKKFGVSTDWLAKRSNSLRQSSYSRSSVKSNTSKLDAMIKSASAKPIRSNRKLSFIEPSTTKSTKIETNKENTDPSIETNDKKEEITKTISESTPYDLSSEIDEDKENEKDDDDDSSPRSKAFSLRIPRVNLPDEENKRLSKRSSSSSLSSNDEFKQEKIKPKKKRRSKKEITTIDVTKKISPKKENDEQITTTTIDDTKKKSTQKKDKNDQAQSRIEHLKKLLRISGIRLIIKKTELDELPSNKAKINYLKSLFDTAGFTGNLTIKECEKFRKKRDTEKELREIQANAVDVTGHVKGGRTLRGHGRNTSESDLSAKRKRTESSEIEDNDKKNNINSSDDEKPIVKKRRIMTMEASPEVSENE